MSTADVSIPKPTFLPVPVPAAPQTIGSGTPRSLETLAEALKKSLGASAVRRVETKHAGDPYVVVSAEKLHDAVAFARDSADFLCTNLEVISATDFAPREAKAATESEPAVIEAKGRIEIAYVVSSYQFKHQLTIKVELDRDRPKVASICDLYRAANWYERECYDMVGASFEGHPNHVRILLPTDWVGYPLRRDYVFPEEYNGMKVPL